MWGISVYIKYGLKIRDPPWLGSNGVPLRV